MVMLLSKVKFWDIFSMPVPARDTLGGTGSLDSIVCCEPEKKNIMNKHLSTYILKLRCQSIIPCFESYRSMEFFFSQSGVFISIL